MTNLESQGRQYDLVETARAYGFKSIDVIDDDLGISASGCAERPGFGGRALAAGLWRPGFGGRALAARALALLTALRAWMKDIARRHRATC